MRSEAIARTARVYDLSHPERRMLISLPMPVRHSALVGKCNDERPAMITRQGVQPISQCILAPRDAKNADVGEVSIGKHPVDIDHWRT